MSNLRIVWEGDVRIDFPIEGKTERCRVALNDDLGVSVYSLCEDDFGGPQWERVRRLGILGSLDSGDIGLVWERAVHDALQALSIRSES